MFDACCCIDTEYEEPEFFIESEPTSRKEHKCGECGAVIKPGEKYRKESGKWGGHFDTHKTCMPCAHVRDDRMSCGFFYGRIWEDLAECYRQVCDDLSWLHPMFADTAGECECEDCEKEREKGGDSE